MDSINSKKVANLAYWGLGLVIFGSLCGAPVILLPPFALSFPDWGIFAVAIFGLGAVIFLIAMVLAVTLRSKEGKKSTGWHQGALILSRFAVSENGDLVFSDFETDAPSGKLLVQVEFANGKQREFRTSWPVFLQCNEGMRGAVLIEGDWISSFAMQSLEVTGPQHPPSTFNRWDRR